MTLLSSEIEWINRNKQYYSSELHRLAVIGNITKRYELNRLKRLLCNECAGVYRRIS